MSLTVIPSFDCTNVTKTNVESIFNDIILNLVLMVFNITVGSKVFGPFGQFLPLQPGQKKRRRSTIHGVVVESRPNSMWRIYWTCIRRTADLKTRGLNYNGPSNMSDQQLLALNSPQLYLGIRKHLDNYFSSTNENGVQGGWIETRPTRPSNSQNNSSSSKYYFILCTKLMMI